MKNKVKKQYTHSQKVKYWREYYEKKESLELRRRVLGNQDMRDKSDETFAYACGFVEGARNYTKAKKEGRLKEHLKFAKEWKRDNPAFAKEPRNRGNLSAIKSAYLDELTKSKRVGEK